MPRIRRAGVRLPARPHMGMDSAKGLQDFRGDVGVGVDFLDIIQVFQNIHHLQQPFRQFL